MTRIGITAAFLVLAAGAAEDGLKDKVEKLVAQVRVSEADFDLSTPRGQEAYKAADMAAAEAGGELLAALQKHPEAWKWARPGLKLPRAAERRDLKYRLIELLAHDSDAETLKLLDAELAADAKAFPVRSIIRMDANGAPGAAKALDKLVAEEPGFRNLEAAIHLGLKGKKNALPVLQWAIESGAGKRHFFGVSFGTAIALKRLGNPTPWMEIRARCGDEVSKYLKLDEFSTAARYALMLEFYSRLAAGDGRIRVLDLDGDCNRHIAKRTPEVSSAEDLHELLQDCAKP